MTIFLNQAGLHSIFHDCGFDYEQQVFFVEALQNTDPLIAHRYFERNCSIDDAITAAEQDDVIGPPMGIGEYLAPLHTMLAERSGDPVAAERRLNECFAGTTTTEEHIMAGRLGVYTLRPILSVFQSFGLTIEEFNQEYKDLVKEFGGPEMVRNNKTFQKRVNEMLAQVVMELARGPSVHIAQPRLGHEPSM